MIQLLIQNILTIVATINALKNEIHRLDSCLVNICVKLQSMMDQMTIEDTLMFLPEELRPQVIPVAFSHRRIVVLKDPKYPEIGHPLFVDTERTESHGEIYFFMARTEGCLYCTRSFFYADGKMRTEEESYEYAKALLRACSENGITTLYFPGDYWWENNYTDFLIRAKKETGLYILWSLDSEDIYNGKKEPSVFMCAAKKLPRY